MLAAFSFSAPFLSVGGKRCLGDAFLLDYDEGSQKTPGMGVRYEMKGTAELQVKWDFAALSKKNLNYCGEKSKFVRLRLYEHQVVHKNIFCLH